MSEPLWRATPVERGCGLRSPGGIYVESGIGPGGTPLATFLIDPPMPLPEGLDLANKAQLWEDPRSDPAVPLVHLLIWVGAEHYPYLPDFLEEAERYGISRKLSPLLDLSRLTPESRMYLAHPKARNSRWQDQAQPWECGKHVIGHAQVPNLATPIEPAGPCLYKTYELMPRDASLDPEAPVSVEGRSYFPRSIGSTDYLFCPTGESPDGLEPGVFAAVPITGFALIKRVDGSVNEHAEASIRQTGLPSYHADE